LNTALLTAHGLPRHNPHARRWGRMSGHASLNPFQLDHSLIKYSRCDLNTGPTSADQALTPRIHWSSLHRLDARATCLVQLRLKRCLPPRAEHTQKEKKKRFNDIQRICTCCTLEHVHGIDMPAASNPGTPSCLITAIPAPPSWLARTSAFVTHVYQRRGFRARQRCNDRSGPLRRMAKHT
jgi:hypothetical protein